MTGTRDTQQDGSIQAMLRDSGLEAATELRNSLNSSGRWFRTRHPHPAPTSRRSWRPERQDRCAQSH